MLVDISGIRGEIDMRNGGKKFLAGLCLASIFVQKSQSMSVDYQANTNSISQANLTGNKKNILKYVLSPTMLGAVGIVAITAIIGAHFTNNPNNLSPEQRIMKFFETVPSVYDCDKQTIDSILGSDINDVAGRAQRYYEKVKEVSKKIDLDITIPSEYEKQLGGYSIPMLLVLMSDMLRTIKLKENDPSIRSFGFAVSGKPKTDKGGVSMVGRYKVRERSTLNFKFRINDESKIGCTILEAKDMAINKIVLIVFNGSDWKNIKLCFGN